MDSGEHTHTLNMGYANADDHISSNHQHSSLWGLQSIQKSPQSHRHPLTEAPPSRSSGYTCTSSSPPCQTPTAHLPSPSHSAVPPLSSTPTIYTFPDDWCWGPDVLIIHIILVSIKVVDIHLLQQLVIYTIHWSTLRYHRHYLITLHCQSYHAISPSQYGAYLHALGECIQLLLANRMDMLYELLLHRTLFSLVKTLIPFVNDSNQPSSLKLLLECNVT